MHKESDHPSKLPKRSYSSIIVEQVEQLKNDELVLRFEKSRKKLSSDIYRPAYHYVNPEGNLNDPNGLCIWRDRYHLFYQAYPPEDPRQHWGHTVSDDLVHWRDLPLAIYPGIENCCFSGSTLVEDDRVIAFYHGTGAGNMAAVSSDPLLLNWEKIPGNPVIPAVETDELGQPYRIYDPCIWREKDGYYALSGTSSREKTQHHIRMTQQLFFSQDLRRWIYLGPFVEGDIYTAPGEDGAVPYFWPIGDRYALIFASHVRGAQYLIGDYDSLNHKFFPFTHGRFNFGTMTPAAVHAPSATPDGKGGLYVIYNMNQGKPTEGWNHIMSIVRQLTLRDDSTLSIEPVPAIEMLRFDEKHVGETALPANEEIVFNGIVGNTMELSVKIDVKEARHVCINVLRSPGKEEYTSIIFYKSGRHSALALDISESSILPDVEARPPEIAPIKFEDGEILDLRIFIDRSVVEVFANSRQCVALRVYPGRTDSAGVSVLAKGNGATLRSLDAWQMKSIWS